ncbi:MAG: LysE family translocator [Myxococcota bacterium]|nr:LysE family translocator [Myxococcota bacterium]
MNLVTAAALGLGLGIVTGMPLGVINVAIVDATVAGHRRFAMGIGIGGAVADAVHAALAFIGVGQLLLRRPDLVRALAIAAAVLVIAYAVIAWRTKRVPTKQIDATSPRAVLTGLMLTLVNPGALSAWVAVAALWPGVSVAEAITLAVAVGVGSATWFTLLAYVVSRVPREHRALQIIPKVALLALLALAIVGVVRVL